MDRAGKLTVSQVVRKVGTPLGELEVVATWMDEDEWELSIVTPKGCATTWLELYSCAHSAIEAGVNAIDEEGHEGFFTSILDRVAGNREEDWTLPYDDRTWLEEFIRNRGVDHIQRHLHGTPNAGKPSGKRGSPFRKPH